ncbi:hypothetical protein DFA_11160 [Cavenderia fasciculata]|uniref:Protein kinase domain-containing protein n=1 Tax=Cavenderia fasciculata TaxID=261658 RepID=F4QF40_CACFS|nr:uncharacterized protein DFA_11160 [Cavenderia fasciculata]EGG13399.1 hypothetical protein DFA_11160 [Cavenderia fasciculata]|eukprot:XP_004350103.1 hypothetical protein DFA_11160 [Cavenderia fasciculata]
MMYNIESIDYKNKKIIGRSTQSEVFLVQDANFNNIAMKHYIKGSLMGFNGDNAKWRKIYNNEESKEPHPNLVKFIAFKQVSLNKDQEEEQIILMDYIEKGSLLEYLTTHKKSALTWKNIFNIIRGTIEAMLFLHQKGVNYCGVKLANILIDNDYNSKLSIFNSCLNKREGSSTGGASVSMERDKSAVSLVDEKQLDSYSLGIILLAIANINLIRKEIASPDTLASLGIPDTYKQLINTCLFGNKSLEDIKNSFENVDINAQKEFGKYVEMNIDKIRQEYYKTTGVGNKIVIPTSNLEPLYGEFYHRKEQKQLLELFETNNTVFLTGILGVGKSTTANLFGKQLFNRQIDSFIPYVIQLGKDRISLRDQLKQLAVGMSGSKKNADLLPLPLSTDQDIVNTIFNQIDLSGSQLFLIIENFIYCQDDEPLYEILFSEQQQLKTTKILVELEKDELEKCGRVKTVQNEKIIEIGGKTKQTIKIKKYKR